MLGRDNNGVNALNPVPVILHSDLGLAVRPQIFQGAVLAHSGQLFGQLVGKRTTATTGVIHVMGEISTSCYVDIASVAREVVKEIGYDDPACGFDGNTCGVLTSILSDFSRINPKKKDRSKNEGSLLRLIFRVSSQGEPRIRRN